VTPFNKQSWAELMTKSCAFLWTEFLNLSRERISSEREFILWWRTIAAALRVRQWHWDFYPLDAMLARVIAIATCPSVRPSHAGIVSKRRKLASVMISSPSGSPTILVFWCQIPSRHSKGLPRPRAGASDKGGVSKISSFLSLSVNISKTIADTAKVTISD